MRTDQPSSPELSLTGVATGALKATYIAVAGYVAFLLWAALIQNGLAAIGIDVGPVLSPLLQPIAILLGTLTAIFFFVRWSEQSLDYLDIAWLDRQDWTHVALGAVGLLGVVGGFDVLSATLGIESAQHGILAQARETPEILLALTPLAILCVGPGEELLYRNLVQKPLYSSVPRWAAVAIASVVFALVHLPAYLVSSPSTGALAASLGVTFGLSLVLGWIYERTRNIVVPALVHGGYDAVVYTVLYLEITGGV